MKESRQWSHPLLMATQVTSDTTLDLRPGQATAQSPGAVPVADSAQPQARRNYLAMPVFSGNMINSFTRRRIWLLAMLGLVVFSAVMFHSVQGKPTPAPLVAVVQPFYPPLRARDRIESWLPFTPRWAWTHTVVDTLFGKRTPVNVDSEAFVFDGAFNDKANELELGRPSYSTGDGGLTVWFLTNGEIKALRSRLETAGLGRAFRCRINTADGIGATLFMGESVVLSGVTNQVGVAQSYLPLVKATGTDLFTSTCVSEVRTNDSLGGESRSIHTNADFAVRIQIPPRLGIFMLKREPPADGRRSAGVVLDAL
jgi:hypothetical protein